MKMYESGKLATSEMADQLEVSVPTVYNHLRRLGLSTATLPRRYRAAVKSEFSEKEKQRIVQLAQEGVKLAEMAVQIKRTSGPTRRIFRELGLTTTVNKPLRSGERFAALTVVDTAPSQKTYKGHYESRSHVVCDCGNTLTVFNSTLRAKNTSSCGCRINRKNPDAVWVRIRCQIESGARLRGLDMNLTNAQLKYVCALPCAYCDSPAMNKLKGRKAGRSTTETIHSYSGIDRVDSKKGYIPGNVLPCCRFCNRAKSNASLKEFLDWLAKFGSVQNVSDISKKPANIGSKLQLI
jgi:transposase